MRGAYTPAPPEPSLPPPLTIGPPSFPIVKSIAYSTATLHAHTLPFQTSMRRRQPSLLSIFKNTDKTRGRQLYNDGCSGGDSPPCPLVVLQMSTTVYFPQPGCSHNKAPD